MDADTLCCGGTRQSHGFLQAAGQARYFRGISDLPRRPQSLFCNIILLCRETRAWAPIKAMPAHDLPSFTHQGSVGSSKET